MVGSVVLHGGKCWVTWWRVLCYMVWSVGLHEGECCVTWGMLVNMEGSVGLPGDSPTREWMFNAGSGGLTKMIHSPIEFIFNIYPNSIVFPTNSLFITFIKNVCQ